MSATAGEKGGRCQPRTASLAAAFAPRHTNVTHQQDAAVGGDRHVDGDGWSGGKGVIVCRCDRTARGRRAAHGGRQEVGQGGGGHAVVSWRVGKTFPGWHGAGMGWAL